MLHPQRRKLLQESQESKSISAAKKLLIDKLDYSPEQADSVIRNDLRGDITALRTKEGGKFILGCTRLFVDKQLSDANKIDDLNETLKIIIADKVLYEKFDRNLNGLTLQDLVQQFEQIRKDRLEQDRKSSESRKRVASKNYRIVLIPSFEEAKKFHKYTDWCLTYIENQWNSYTAYGYNTVYFCVRRDVDSIKEPTRDEGESLDSWDLSLISVIVGPDGALRYCTGRYNHRYASEADHVMDKDQLEDLLGVNFYEAFKPISGGSRLKQAAKAFLDSNGDLNSLRNYFRGIYKPNSDKTIVPVRLPQGEGCNYFLPHKASFLFSEPVSAVFDFREGLSVYLINDSNDEDYGNLNIIKEDGSKLLSEDLDDVEIPNTHHFCNGLLTVVQGGLYFYLDTKGHAVEIDLDDDGSLDVEFAYAMSKYGTALVRTEKRGMKQGCCLIDRYGFRCSDFFYSLNVFNDPDSSFFKGYKADTENFFIVDRKTGDTVNSDPYLEIHRLRFSAKKYYIATLENGDIVIIKVERIGDRTSYKQLPQIPVADLRKMNTGLKNTRQEEGLFKVSFDYCDLIIDTKSETEQVTGDVPAPWFSIT